MSCYFRAVLGGGTEESNGSKLIRTDLSIHHLESSDKIILYVPKGRGSSRVGNLSRNIETK